MPENMLQIVIVVFMLFLCALCMFAVVVIVRDIVRESAESRRQRDQRERDTNQPQQPMQTVEVPQTPVVASVAQPSVVAEPQPPEPVVQPIVDTDEQVVDEDDPDAVSFSRVSLTMEERYGTLSTEFKHFFDEIVKHATSKEGVKESKRTGSYDYKIGAYRVLRLMIKRGEIVCEFCFIDREFNEYASDSNIRIKQSATTVRVTEASAVGVVKDGIDLVCQQIDEDKARKKALASQKRKEKRRLAKEADAADVADADQTTAE